MVIAKASPESEAGQLPSEELLREMGDYNEWLAKAGVMLACDGLHPSSKGKRIRFSAKQRAEDLGEEFTPELRAREQRLREEILAQQN